MNVKLFIKFVEGRKSSFTNESTYKVDHKTVKLPKDIKDTLNLGRESDNTLASLWWDVAHSL